MNVNLGELGRLSRRDSRKVADAGSESLESGGFFDVSNALESQRTSDFGPRVPSFLRESGYGIGKLEA